LRSGFASLAAWPAGAGALSSGVADSQPSTRAGAAAADRFPAQIKFIVGNEACERFSFYGMVGILTTYVAKQLGQGDAKAHEISHLFKFGVYFFPLFGAWLSDRVLGRYRTILYISLFYCLGHGVLAFADLTDSVDTKLLLLYAGLGLISFGGGGIKPCVSAFVGDQFGANQSHLLQKAYGLFYWSINFGSFFAFLLIPRLAKDHGYGWAFGVPGIAMALATFIFWLGRHRYVQVPPTRGNGEGYWEMLWHALTHGRDRRPGRGFWDACHARFSAEAIEGCRAVTRVLGVFALIPFFWALYDQSNSTWVTQGNRMEPYRFPAGLMASPLGPAIRLVAGDTIGGEQMQSMNALLVMILVPAFTLGLFPLTERLGPRVTTLRRMATGVFLTAASFVLVAWLERLLDAGHRFGVLWQTAPYVVLTAGEVLVSNTGLEFAFREAPQAMRSTLMSFWLLTVAAGNLAVSQVFRLNVKERLPGGAEVLHVTGANLFLLFAALVAVVGVVFVVICRRYRYRDPESAAAVAR
jgi:proton-dependent oligopeptide transporter, POT family